MKKEKLFTLVKSLSKSEKRYFKVFCQQSGGSNNYVKLFDALDQQTAFDEKAIRKKFRGESFLSQLHVTKNYLRQLILKSLRNYHSRISKDAELKDLLRNIEILYNKELYQHCLTELRRAESMAVKYELKTGRMEVIGWKRKIEQAMRPQNYPRFKEILEEQQSALAVLKNTHDYWQLAVDVSTSMFVDGEKRGTSNPLLATADNALSLEAKVLFFNTRFVFHLQRSEPEKAIAALEELIGLFEGMPERMLEDPAMYISTINNLLGYYAALKEIDKALELVRRSKGFYQELKLKGGKRSLLKQVMRSYNIELEIYRTYGLYKENMGYVADIESVVMINKAKMPIDYLLSFWFQFANIHFMEKEFDAALKWINLIMNGQFRDRRVDIQVQARFLNLMTHLEKRNYFVMRYFVDSTRRFLKKQKEVKLFEKTLLQFFSRMGRLPDSEWKESFRQLNEDLYGEKGLLLNGEIGYIDYKKWIHENI